MPQSAAALSRPAETADGGERVYNSVAEALENGENPFKSFIRLSDTQDIFPADIFKINEHNDDDRLQEFADSGKKMLELIRTSLYKIVDHKMEHEARTDAQKQILVANGARLREYYEHTLDTIRRHIEMRYQHIMYMK